MPQPTINTPRETTHQRIADALEDIVDKMVDTSSASNIDYDNTQSGLSANKVQGAVDELKVGVDSKIPLSQKGAYNGVAELDSNGKVPSSQLPSYVDDVVEYTTKSAFPSTGESGKIYVDLSTNLTYRWGGTEYVEISSSLALGETSSTAYRGDRGKIAYNHSQTTGNPHGTTKSDVGLGNVDNTSDLNKPISTAAQTALNNKVDKVAGKGLSTNDYTDAEKQKLANIESNAQANVQSDWNEDDTEDDGYIKNKPDISTSQTATGNPLTIEASESNLVECVAEVEAVQEGSGDPSPTNVRPIIGQTEVVIEDVGKNLCGNWNDKKIINSANGNINPYNGYKTCDFIRVSQGQKIYIQSNNTGGEKWWYNKDKTPFQGAGSGVGVKTSPIDGYFAMSVSDANVNTTMIEYGESASTYEPYKGKTYTIQLGDTIYGSELDVLTGELRVTKRGKIFTSTDETQWNQFGSSSIFYTAWIKDGKTPVNIGVTGSVSSQYKAVNKRPTDLSNGEFVTNATEISGAYNSIGVCDSRFSSASDFKASLTTPLEVVYELAEPYTIQLTPQQIRLLKGTNNISCNTGDLSIKYYPDNVLGQLKGDIEKGLNAYYDYQIQALWDKINELQA